MHAYYKVSEIQTLSDKTEVKRIFDSDSPTDIEARNVCYNALDAGVCIFVRHSITGELFRVTGS